MKVILAGGGTLGSVSPLLAVEGELHRRDPGIRSLWVGTEDGPERRLVETAQIVFRPIAAGRLRRFSAWSNLFLPFAILHGLFDSLSVLREWRPDVVVHAGSFVALPLTWAAWLLGIPVHVHQSDWRPGLTNRLSAPFAKSISVSFDKSLRDFPRRKAVLTGNPVRTEVLTADRQRSHEFFGLSASRPTVLVLGGGTGASGLNRLMAEALPQMDPRLQVIHLTGIDKPFRLPNWNGTYVQHEFFDREMPLALAAADLVVTRAGTGTLSELAALGRPAIVVPMPGSHQEDNARSFERAGAAVIFGQDRSGRELGKLVSTLFGNRERLIRMSESMRRLNSPQAAARVADLVLSAAGHSDGR